MRALAALVVAAAADDCLDSEQSGLGDAAAVVAVGGLVDAASAADAAGPVAESVELPAAGISIASETAIEKS